MTRLVASGRAQLACDTHGAGAPIVFLHAGVADRRSWAGTIAAIGADHPCVAYDRRGFGETIYAPERFSHVADLVAVLAAFDARDVVLVGNSQGGRIAIDFALAHPERVRALVLVAPAVSGAVGEAPPAGSGEEWLARAIEAADEAGDVERVGELEAHLWLDGPESDQGRVGGAARALFLDMNGRALRASSPGEEIEPPSAIERVAELAPPVHLVAGGRDVAQITARCRALAAQVPGASLTLFPGAAHLPQLEDPEAFAEDLRAFLVRVG